MPSTSLSEIGSVLDTCQRVLVITHVSPDGDAIGSLLGMGHLLREQGKQVTLAEADPLPPELRSLPGVDTIVVDPPAEHWDAVIALDASDAARLGQPFRPASYGDIPIIVIDHHVTNQRFGTFNWVDPKAAATAQIVVNLADAWGKLISRDAAECLLVGVVTDTRGFRTSNVTPDVLAAAMRLMACGADLAGITERVLNFRPFASVRLWGLALERAQLSQGVIWTEVTPVMREQIGSPDASDTGLVSFLLEVPEARVSAVFNEKPQGNVEISLRARPGYDVSATALDLGGGGHPQAAGCTVDGPLAAAEARVLPLLHAVAGSESRP